MTLARRNVLAALGTVLPASWVSSCARADTAATWPGPDTPPGTLPKLPIGMNLTGIASWQTGFPFRNLMWGADRWRTRNQFGGGPWDTGQAKYLELDPDGYPLEVPFNTPESGGIPQQVFTLLPNQLHRPGRYILLYDGEGSIEGMHGTSVLSEAKGRLVLRLTQTGNVAEGVLIRRSSRGNHIRNIRVFREGEDEKTLYSSPFRQEFLDFCRPFHSLRFMDWGAINDSIEQDWTQRRRPSFYTMIAGRGDAEGRWSPKPTPFEMRFAGGVAHEIVIQLANTLKIDPWICIPHLATDDYIRNCAALYHSRLDPSLKMYLEFSNEIWNWQFKQTHWMSNSEYAGKALEDDGYPAWQMKNGKREGVGHPERIGALFNRAFDLWTGTWPASQRHRIRTVCAVQAAWASNSIRTIDWCKRGENVNAVSPAAYFGPGQEQYAFWESRGASLTVDEVLNSMAEVVERQSREGGHIDTARHARSLDLDLVNYEGGQHIMPKGQKEEPYLPALVAAQSHPRMYDLYVQNLKLQRRLGSKLFCAFASVGKQNSRFGSWGSKEDYDTPIGASPKYRALIDCNS